MVSAPHQVGVQEVPGPEGPGVVVAVQQGGLCGTDRKIVDGKIPVAYPRILGHEVVGHVAGGATDDLPVGTRVLVNPAIWCGVCSLCRQGLEHLCRRGSLIGRDVDGGLAEAVTASPLRLHPVPAAISADDAAVLQVLGTCLHAQRLASVFPTDTAVVFGLGVSGLLHVQLLAARGAARIVGVSRSASKRALALQLGATAVAEPADAAEAIREAAGEGVDLAVESAGVEGTLVQAVHAARPGGTVLMFGTLTGGGGLPYYELYYKELRLLSSRAARPIDYDDAIALVASGAVTGAPLVTTRRPFGDAGDAFEQWFGDPDQLKVVLDI